MSESTPPPLARQIGGIAADLRAQAQADSARTGLAAVLNALILALLARILGRLESMVALWQAGQLPAPIPRPARATTARPAARIPPAPPWRWLAAFLPSAAAARPPSVRRGGTGPRPAANRAPRSPVTATAARPAAPRLAESPRRAPRTWPPHPPVPAPRAQHVAPARPGFSKPAPAAAPSHA